VTEQAVEPPGNRQIVDVDDVCDKMEYRSKHLLDDNKEIVQWFSSKEATDYLTAIMEGEIE
jgi:hypothetical protein